MPSDELGNRPASPARRLRILGEFGRVLFSFAIIAIGVETLICSYLISHSPGSHDKVVQVIPWLPAIAGLAYSVGAIFILCGIGLFFRRTLVAAAITLGVVMLVCGLAFDGPRHPDLRNPEWRTNLLEPIAIGCLAWLMPGAGGIPRWLYRTSLCLLGFSFVVFGVAHFQVLKFIAMMVPGWIPWHRFWALFFGVAFIAAGLSFATGLLRRWAALAAGLMFAIWLATIHLLPVLHYLRTSGATQDPDKWSDVFIVAALWGGMWALARGLRERSGSSSASVGALMS